MEIVNIGQQGYAAAVQRAEGHSRRIVEKGAEVDDVVGLKIAEKEAQVAAKVIETGFEIEGTLLDILA